MKRANPLVAALLLVSLLASNVSAFTLAAPRGLAVRQADGSSSAGGGVDPAMPTDNGGGDPEQREDDINGSSSDGNNSGTSSSPSSSPSASAAQQSPIPDTSSSSPSSAAQESNPPSNLSPAPSTPSPPPETADPSDPNAPPNLDAADCEPCGVHWRTYTLKNGKVCEQCLRDGSRGNWDTANNCASVNRGEGTYADPSEDGRPTACLGSGGTPASRACLTGCNTFLALARQANPCNANIYNAGRACAGCVSGGAILTSGSGSGRGDGRFDDDFTGYLGSLSTWCAKAPRCTDLRTGGKTASDSQCPAVNASASRPAGSVSRKPGTPTTAIITRTSTDADGRPRIGIETVTGTAVVLDDGRPVIIDNAGQPIVQLPSSEIGSQGFATARPTTVDGDSSGAASRRVSRPLLLPRSMKDQGRTAAVGMAALMVTATTMLFGMLL